MGKRVKRGQEKKWRAGLEPGTYINHPIKPADEGEDVDCVGAGL
jgi:hypothetical protein